MSVVCTLSSAAALAVLLGYGPVGQWIGMIG